MYAKNDYQLFLIGRNQEKLDSLIKELKTYSISVKSFCIDLTRKDAAETIYNCTQKEGIVIDILINGAGFGVYEDFLNQNLSDYNKLMQVNISTLVELCFYFGKEMIKNKKGKIINFSSIAAYFPGPYMATYYASKAYILSFTAAFAREVKPFGLSVSAIIPGVIPTRFYDKAKADISHSYLLERMPLGSSKRLAAKVYKGISKNKVIIKDGFLNRILIFFSLFLTFPLKAKIVGWVQRKK